VKNINEKRTEVDAKNSFNVSDFSNLSGEVSELHPNEKLA